MQIESSQGSILKRRVTSTGFSVKPAKIWQNLKIIRSIRFHVLGNAHYTSCKDQPFSQIQNSRKVKKQNKTKNKQTH